MKDILVADLGSDNMKSSWQVAACAVLLSAVLVSGLLAGFHDEALQMKASSLLYPLVYGWTDYDWTDPVDAVAYSILPPQAYAQTPDPGAFVTTWNVTGVPVAPAIAISTVGFHIGVASGGQVTIDWGDGESPRIYNATGQVSHFYRNHEPTVLKNATVTISGDLNRFYFHYLDPVTTNDSPQPLLSIDQWGDTEWSDMTDMFRGAENMQYMATDAPNLSSKPAVADMFKKASAFDGDLSNWDVSTMTSLRYMFNGAPAFNGDISNWDVSKVTGMTYMFGTASAFNGDISSWDVSSVEDMDYMFLHASDFNGDISSWDVSKVADMANMFNGASAFNGDISSWDVSSVTGEYAMSFMFIGASSFYHNLGPWFITLNDTSISNGETLVTDISTRVGFDTDIDNYIVTGTDADDFTITDRQLVLNSASDYSSKLLYDITITASTTNVSSLFLNVEPSISASIKVSPHIGAAPAFSSATYNTGTGVLAVAFSEPISDAVALSGLHVRESGQSSGGVTLTGAASQSVSGSSLAVTLSASQQSTVGGMIAPQLDIDADAVSDAASNGIAAVADRPITISDTVRPSFDSAAYVSSTGILALTFDEPISGGSFPSKIHVHESGQSSGGVTLTGASWTTSGSTVKFFLESSHKSGIASLGTPQLDINPGAVSDVAGNKIARTPDRPITINDTTPPTFDSSTYDEDAGILRITFSEPIYGLATDLSKIHVRDSGQSSGGVALTGAADQPVSVGTLTVRLSASQQSTVNAMSTPQLDIDAGAISDTSTNQIAATTDRPTDSDTDNTAVTDTTAPTLLSIERYSPSSATTDSQTLIYEVTFSEDVSGVNTSDFTLSSSSTGGTGGGGTSEQFTQTRSPALAITLANTISDTITVPDSGTATSVSVAVDVTHTYIGDLKIDLIAPDGTTKTLHGNTGGSADDIDQTYTPDFDGESIAGAWTLRISDSYAAADDGTLNSWTLTINHGSGTASPVTSVTGSGDTYYATVSATQDGTYNLDLVSSGHGIEDESSNPLTNTTPTGSDETYTVSTATTDTTPPRLSSIERYSPSSATTSSQTLIYQITFSEDVSGVNTSDFALSSSSTGGTGGGGTSGQFTQTRSPALAITLANTISDTITVPDSGTATSVSVAVDVTHTYIGDLKVDLIAPDGTTKTLHGNTGGSADDIDQTYAPDFDGESIAGAWTLRISDSYASADDGTLNSWTLTINHGSGGGTASPVTSISGSGDTYYATVSAIQDGTYNLDLVSSGHGIEDESSNPLTNTTPTGADETYTVSTATTDTTPPRLSSIERYSPSSATTSSQTLIYQITFSEDVSGVNTSDFALSSSSTGGTSTSSSQFTQTRSPALAITLANTISDTITVPDSGTATSVSVAVDVTHTYIGDLKIDLIAPDGTTETVHNRSGGSTDDIDQTYTPDFEGESIAGAWTLRISDSYAAADDGTLNSWTLTINHGSGTASPVTSISGSGDTYYATVSATTDGTYNLDLVSSGHGIEDESSNPLTNTTPTGSDETYTVSTTTTDTTAPTISSIERYSPTSQSTSSQTLTYEVTFSEDVSGVNTSDFALSSSSTGGTSTSSSQFTQTRSPALAITLANTISDTITVPDSGTATSVSVAVDVTHTYIGDLKIDLIAPDGTTKTLHGNTGGSADDIDQTYAPDFDGESIAGTWTLRISDNYASADDGTLNSWTLTINHGTGSTIVSPVTGVSGSGDTYYVTVSSSTDGTYNLDLVSSNHNIKDAANNFLSNTSPTGADETYTVSTAATDTTPPRLSSIERYSPSSATTSSQTLTYEVTFSEDVSGVNTSDFALSSSSTGGTGGGGTSGQFTQTSSPSLAITQANTISDTITVPDSGTATSVSVAVDVTHTYIGDLKIDLIAPDGTTKTLHGNTGGSADDIDQTYTPDFDGESIAGAWTLRISDSYAAADDGTLNSWTLTINHGSGTASPVTSISGSGDTYYATVSATTDGTYNLDLVSSGHGISDESSNPLTNTTPTGSDETYTVSTAATDTTPPRLSSIERYSPSSATTSSQTLTYEVTFSEDVSGVNTSDFALSSSSTGGTGGGGTSGQFTQTSSPSLAITQANTISDTITVPDSGTATSVSVAVDVTHTYIGDLKIDLIAPDGTTKTLHGNTGGSADDIDQTYTPDFDGESIAGAWTLRISDSYAAADDGTLNSWTLTINHGSGTASPVTSISGSGDTYYATVSATTDGTYNLDLVSSGHGISDESSNPLTNTTPTGSDETYTVSTAATDTTPPRLSSIERYSPSSATTSSQTLTYEVTFSEDVSGVNTSDFALSSSSTGGTSTSSSQFTQTRSPALAITLANTISDTITVPDSGTATSVSVAVDVTHTYIGDLKIDLIAPDGTTKTLHGNTGGSADDIDQTYAPDFGGESIAGAWTLRINDNYASADDGTLNSWTLTINHGTGSTIVSPVTGVSGSGDTYYVTVSSSTDGTYNLDLVSSNHNIKDAANNFLSNTSPTGADETYTVSTAVTDTTNPRLESIERFNPSSAATNSQSLVYRATFSESVTGVGTSDFVLSTGGGNAGTGSVTSISGSGSVYYVTVTAAQDGTYNLDLVSSGHGIKDAADNSLTNTTSTTGTDETYTVSITVTDTAAPTILSIERNNPSSAVTSTRVLTYKVTFSEDVTGVDKADFVLSPDSTGSTSSYVPVVYVGGSGSVYTVIVVTLNNGTYNLDLVSSGHGIADTDDNLLTNIVPVTGTDETYTYTAAN